MASINATSMRLTGMASGMDTEGIVKNLMSVDKFKVDSVKKQKVLLEWKQEYYKEITNKLNSFQSKYFGSKSSDNVMDGALNSLAATYNSPYISVVAGSSAVQGSMYISDIVSLASSAKLEGTQHVSSDPKITVNTEALNDLAGKSIAVTLDGITKAVTFSTKAYATSQDVQNELSSQLAASFGAGRVNVALNGDELSLSSENSALRISVPTDAEKNPTGILDFDSYSSNRIDLNQSLSQAGFSRDIFASPEDSSLSFTINGKDFSFTGQSKLSDIMQAINKSDAGVTVSYSALTDTFSMVSKSTGAASSVTASDSHGYLMDALFGGARYSAGTDSVVRMSTNGSKNEEDMITVQRSTNSFTVNGSTISLLGKADGTGKEDINISTANDADAIVEKVKSFVSDYNELLGLVTSRTSEEHYRDYQPLSDDEKKELSDKEVELWTTKAKSGILRNDSNLQSIATELKSSIYSAVKEVGGSNMLGILADIGITTENYTEKGQLHLDESKLRKALSENPEKTLNLLTQKSSASFSVYASKEVQQKRFAESGVLWRLSDVLSKNLNTVGKKGALIELVGSPNSSYKGATLISKRIDDIQDRIDSMEDKMVSREKNYWKKFSTMETAMNKMNSQTSWLSGMLGQMK